MVVTGAWDWDRRIFSAGAKPRNALEVTVTQLDSPLFFGRIFGETSFDASARAIATYRPRDMMLVLDISGSMNDEDKIKHLKSAVDLFFDALDLPGDQDRVGLVTYSTDAKLEIGLTSDFKSVNKFVQKVNAEGWTNIGGGMELGRNELNLRGRRMAKKMIVVMTDGLANRPPNVDPKNYVLDQGRTAVGEGIEVVTIAFGNDADNSLMKKVADKSTGTHFHVKGSIRKLEKDLKKAFLVIATHRPTVLVQ
jgi:Mg-chelatase subunit ChlD